MKFQTIDIPFPLGGLDVSRAFGDQTATMSPLGASYDQSFRQEKFETCAAGVNVRGYDAMQSRFRGGSRPGLTKYVSTQPNGASPIQGMGIMSVTGLTAPVGGVQPSLSGRIIYLVVVVNGSVRYTWPGANIWVTPTGGNAIFNTTGIVRMTYATNSRLAATGVAAGAPTMYICDGNHAYRFNPAAGAVGIMTGGVASSNGWGIGGGGVSFPHSGTGQGSGPALLGTWRGRILVSGISNDPTNIFASAVGDGTNWNYAPTSITANQAWALNSSPSFGQIGDFVSGLVPINDDNLLVLGDSTISIIRGDPMAGGQFQRLLSGIGGYFGNAWCIEPEGVVYFLSNRLGVYRFDQFSYPKRISQHIDPILQQLVGGPVTVSMVWDDWLQGLHIFITNTATPTTATTHYFWERRTGAWWQDKFASGSHNPLCGVTFDGNNPNDRRALIGCNDGYVRYLDLANGTDDGTSISSSVTIGPIATGMASMMIRDLKAYLDTASSAVNWTIQSGFTPQAALTNPGKSAGTWLPGNNSNAFPRVSGKAMYLILSSSSQWALEKIRAFAADMGPVLERRGV